MTITEMLEEVEAAARGNDRLDVVAKYIKESSLFSNIITDTVDTFITFGVQKFTMQAHGGTHKFSDTEWAEEMLALGVDLRDRKLTGTNAQVQLANFRHDCNASQLKWAERYFLRDLRLDLGAKSIQKIVGKAALPLFEVPLATDYVKVKKIEGRYVSQPKYDGARVVAFIKSNSEVELRSRTGKLWKNFKPIEEAILAFVKASNLHQFPYVLDGEVVALDENGEIDFQAVQAVLMRGDGVVGTYLEYIVFDGCPLAEWIDSKQNYIVRLQNVEALFAAAEDDVPTHIDFTEYSVMTLTEAEAVETLKKEAFSYVQRRYEGGIARKANAPVQNKRSSDILKVKSFQDAEAVVLATIEGTGKYEGMLGALHCKLPTGETFDIGSGFTDTQRITLWDAVESDSRAVLGKTLTFKFFEKTKDGIPRFPIFKGFRNVDDFNKESDED